MQNVTVTNKNAESFTGRFDGREYVFPPGEPVTVNSVVAGFLFGYGAPKGARARVLIRNGWHRNGDPNDPFGPKAATAKLRNFIFKGAADDPPPAKPKPHVLASQRPKPPPAEPVEADSKSKTPVILPGSSAPLAPSAAAR